MTRYPDPLDWILSFPDSERSAATASPGGWDLRRTRALLDLAGPAPNLGLTVALVAGTNGKGSTCAFLASILGAAGIRTGLYTQPHLQRYAERVRVDGEAITLPELRRAVTRMRALVEDLRRTRPDLGTPTTFELTTALAVWHFAHSGCSVAVIEVGLGGRLDATNALEPAVSVITPISHDHVAILGPTLRQIAHEKAGIARRGHPVLSARQRPAALESIEAACSAVGAELRVISPRELPQVLRPSLEGRHQRQNAALARAAALMLAGEQATIEDATVARGLARVAWPARFEVIQGRPLVVVDGAHNDGSAEALAGALRDRFGRRVSLVIGVMRDKDAVAIIRHLVPLAARIWTCAPPGERGRPADDLARLAKGLTRVRVVACASVAEALERARIDAPSRPICIAGSLALAGAAREALGLPWVRRLWPRERPNRASARPASRAARRRSG